MTSFVKSDERILFSRIRNIALKYGENPHFKAWLKQKRPDLSFHHVCASVHGRKSTDLLANMVPLPEHMEQQDNIDWLVEQVPFAMENLILYVLHLQQLLKEKEGG